MQERKENKDLSIVFSGQCDVKKAVDKLRDAEVGSFLIRASSVDGLISMSAKVWSPKKNEEVFIHERFAITPGTDGRLTWVVAPSDAIKAREYAAKCENAFDHIHEQTDSLQGLLKLLQSYNVDFGKIITPKNENESALGYFGYDNFSYHSAVNFTSNVKPGGYGKE